MSFVINVLFLALAFRPLRIATFDPQFARSIGIRTGLLNGSFMFLVALTVTAAFNAAGAILVIALVVAPPATAALVTRRLGSMFAVTVAVAVIGSAGGFWVAYELDAATSAGIAVFLGAVFLLVFAATRLAQRVRRRTLAATASGAPHLDLQRDAR